MALASLKKLVRWLRTSAPVADSDPRFPRRLGVEALEDRLTPALVMGVNDNYWAPLTGGSHNWSDAANWSLGHVPTSTDVLHFANLNALSAQTGRTNIDTGVNGYTSLDDTPNATVAEIDFDGIANVNTAGGSPVEYRIATPVGAANVITVTGSVRTRTQAVYVADAAASDDSNLTVNINPQVSFVNGGTILAGGDTSSTKLHNTTDTLNFVGTVSNGNGALLVSGVQTVEFKNPTALTGSGALTVTDSGLTGTPTLCATLRGGWGNSGGAATTVTSGTLKLSWDNAAYTPTLSVSIPGSLTVGTGSGKGANVILTGSFQTAPTSAVTVNADGNFLFQNLTTVAYQDTIGPLTLNGGTINTHWDALNPTTSASKTGVLTLNGDVVSVTNAKQATIVGVIDLGAGPVRTFTIGANAATEAVNPIYAKPTSNSIPAVDVQAVITSKGGATTLVKQGQGFLQLDAANTSTAGTDVQAGVLWLSNRNALQKSATTVRAGAGLNAIIQAATGLVEFNCPLLTLNGAGDTDWSDSRGNHGALYANDYADFDTVRWTGPIVLGSNSTIDTEWGTTLEVTGTISDPAGLPAGTLGAKLTTTGTGTLILNNDNSYTGPTDIAQGNLMANRVFSLGGAGVPNLTPAGTGVVTVKSGASLLLAGGNTFAPKTLSLFGTGNNVNASDSDVTNGGFSALQGMGADPYGLGISSGCLDSSSDGTPYTTATGTNIWTGNIVINGTVQIGATRGNTLQVGYSDNGTGAISGTGTLQINRPTLDGATGTDTDFSFNALGWQAYDAPTAGGKYNTNALGYDTGIVLLCGNSTYTGNTTVRAGMLTLANSTALGAPGQTATVNNYTTLRLRSTVNSPGSTAPVVGISVNENLSLRGQGVYQSPDGAWVQPQAALWNVIGSIPNPNTWAGNIVLQSLVLPTTILATPPTPPVTLAAATAGDAIGAVSGTQLTIAGNISTKNGQLGEMDFAGPGTVQLQGDNSGYNGNTFINAGTVVAATNTPFGAGNSPAFTNKTTTTVLSGATLALSGATVTGGYLTVYGTLAARNGLSVWNGTDGGNPANPNGCGVTVAGAGATYKADSGAILSIRTNQFLAAPLTISGTGTVNFSDQLFGSGSITVGTGTTSSAVTFILNPTSSNTGYTGGIAVSKYATLYLGDPTYPPSSPQAGPTKAIMGTVTLNGGTLAVPPNYWFQVGGLINNAGTVNANRTGYGILN